MDTSIDVALLVETDKLLMAQHGEPGVSLGVLATAMELDHVTGGFSLVKSSHPSAGRAWRRIWTSR